MLKLRSNSFLASFFVLKVVTQRHIGDALFSRSTTVDGNLVVASPWSWYKEEVGIWGNNSFTKPGLLEQINTTKDTSDFLWYSTR